MRGFNCCLDEQLYSTHGNSFKSFGHSDWVILECFHCLKKIEFETEGDFQDWLDGEVA